MPTLVADCPRCGARDHTFDVTAHVKRTDTGHVDWLRRAEVFSICRRCLHPTTFIIQIAEYRMSEMYDQDTMWTSDVSLNRIFKVLGYVSLKDLVSRKAPDHCPEQIAAVFNEGAACMSIGCHNAAATMFRLCLDIATRGMLPPPPPDGTQPGEGVPNAGQRRNLGLRLPWLIENGKLPAEIKDLAEVVREDGNDGAHAGTLTQSDAEDLADFTEVLLERLFTEPGRLDIARARRTERRRSQES